MSSTAGRSITVGALVLVTACGGGPVPGEAEPRGRAAESSTLLVVGDWGAGTTEQRAVAEAMSLVAESRHVGAILTTGDNFYTDDAVGLMEPFSWATDGDIPFWIAWGNHDVDSDARIDAVNEVFGEPPRWVTYRWGEVDIVVLDSTRIASDVQAEFLTNTLAGSDLPTIVVIHHPPLSCGAHGGTGPIRDSWVSQFDDDVFLVLSGHEHNYQRFDHVSGVTYVVTGGGGAALTELAPCPTGHPDLSAGEALHHFLVLEQDDGEVLASAIDIDGDVVDEFEMILP